MRSIIYAALLIGLLGFSNSFSVGLLYETTLPCFLSFSSKVFESDQETDGNTIIMNAAPRNEPMDAPNQPMKVCRFSYNMLSWRFLFLVLQM